MRCPALQHDRVLKMNCIASPSVTSVSELPLLAPVGGRAVQQCFYNSFVIAGIDVRITADTATTVDFNEQLLPFAAESNRSEIEVEIAWASRLEPIEAPALFNSGCVWSVHQQADEFIFDFATARFGDRPYKRMIVDKSFRRATILLNRQLLQPEDASRALEYPLDELLITHHLCLGPGVELHACGVVNDDGKSFLFAGHSGAGKSTTARLWSERPGIRVLSDDRIIVRHVGSGGQECAPHTGRIDPFLMHGTPWHGEAAFALPESAPIQRIFLLEHGGENRIERISRGEAVGELLARSFTPFYASRFVEPALTFLEHVADSVPCYRFRFVPDRSAVERIVGFHD